MGKFNKWKKRRGKPNRPHAYLPREGRLAPFEVKTILDFYRKNFRNGYRHITFMILDEEVFWVSPRTVYRVKKLVYYANGTVRSRK